VAAGWKMSFIHPEQVLTHGCLLLLACKCLVGVYLISGIAQSTADWSTLFNLCLIAERQKRQAILSQLLCIDASEKHRATSSDMIIPRSQFARLLAQSCIKPAPENCLEHIHLRLGLPLAGRLE
jgi:hypothetical protein